MKVNWDNTTPVKYMVLKFIQRLKLQIILIVYAKNLVMLDVTITMAKNIERRLVIANKSK